MNGAGDGTGEVNSIVQRAIDAGILWVNAAGNSNGDTYQGSYNSVLSPPGIPTGVGYSLTNDFHDFDPSGAVVVVNPLFGGLTFNCDSNDYLVIDAILRWDDWNPTRTGNLTGDDYDMFLMQSTNGGTNWIQAVDIIFGFPVESSFIQGGIDSKTPEEDFFEAVACSAPNTMYGILIERFEDNGVNYLDLITWGSGPLDIASADTSISTPADSQYVLSVAAGEVKPRNMQVYSPR
jgi:hypothetical protein